MSISDMMGRIQTRAFDKSYEFRIEPGENVKVRFLGDIVLDINVHNRFIKGDFTRGYKTPCPKGYNHTCLLDDLLEDQNDPEGRRTVENWSFLIWDYRDSSVKILLHSNKSLLTQIGEFFVENSSLTLTDCIIKRSVEGGLKTKYRVVFGRKDTDFEYKAKAIEQLNEVMKIGTTINFNDEILVKKIIRELVARTFNHDLLQKNYTMQKGWLEDIVVKKQEEVEEDDDTDLLGDDDFLDNE